MDAMLSRMFLEMLESPDVATRRSAASALTAGRDPATVEPLIAALNDSDYMVRLFALKALGYKADRRALAPVLAVFADDGEDQELRAVAAEALGRLAFPEGFEALLAALNSPATPASLREMAAIALGGFPGSAPAAKLAALASAQDRELPLRLYALESLGYSGNPEAVAPLLALLEDEESRVRAKAAQALRHFNDPRALAALKQRHERKTAEPGKAEPVQAYSFPVYADYNQFYLGDSDLSAGLYSDLWTRAEEYQAALAVRPGLLAVGTARYAFVPVEIEVRRRRPFEDDFEGWDQVVEGELQVPSGRVVIDGCTAFRPGESPSFEVRPGRYVARVYYGGLAGAAFDNQAGEDYYKIALWPGERQGVRVLKRFGAPQGKNRGW